jgi:hypothetical protein
MEVQNLEYSPVSGAWPLEAKKDGVVFTFSGSFSRARIAAEKAAKAANSLVDMVLYIITGIGVAAFVYGALTVGLEEYDFFFPFHAHWFNIFVWVAVLGLLYLWARRVQQAAEYEVTRVLSWANVSAWGARGQPVDVYNLFTRGAHEVWDAVPSLIVGQGDVPTTVDIFLALLTHESIKLVFLSFWRRPRPDGVGSCFGKAVLGCKCRG